jgi:hypothetical protein
LNVNDLPKRFLLSFAERECLSAVEPRCADECVGHIVRPLMADDVQRPIAFETGSEVLVLDVADALRTMNRATDGSIVNRIPLDWQRDRA